MSTQWGPSQSHTCLFLHRCCKHSIILDISNNNNNLLKTENALSTSRECVHVKRSMRTAWKQYSLLIDISSILQERAQFCTSTTNQRQLMLHTTNFMYAARKPSVYFTSVFKVHHLKRGAWTVLYSTREITKRNADFWKGSKTHTVNPDMIWMQILSNLVSKGNKTSKTGPCVPRRRFTHSTHCSLVLEVQIFWL